MSEIRPPYGAGDMCVTSDKLAPSLKEIIERYSERVDRLETLSRAGLHFSTALRCPACKALLRYIDEPPPWRESEARRAEVERNRAFADEHRGKNFPAFYETGNKTLEAWIRDVNAHRFLRFANPGWGSHGNIDGVKDVDLRCVDCPSCGREVFMEDAVEG